MHHQSRSLKSKLDSADKKLNKMSMGDKDYRQQTDILGNLREQVRTLDSQVMDEEASLGDLKRVKAREWMSALFGGLLGCSANGAVVATSGLSILECIPTDVTQPGLPRAHYSGHSQVELLLAEAERTLRKISSVSEAGVSFGSEAGVSVASEAGDRTPNGSGVGDIPANPPPSLPIQPTPIQPTPTQPVQPFASSTHPNNPPSNLHELSDFGEYNPYPRPQSQTYAPGQWSHEPLPASTSAFTPSHPPPRPLGLSRSTPGLAASFSSSSIQPSPTPQLAQLAARLAATEEQIRSDAELAMCLQAVDDESDFYVESPEMQDSSWYVAERPPFLCQDLNRYPSGRSPRRPPGVYQFVAFVIGVVCWNLKYHF